MAHDGMTIRERALACLSRREYSRLELKRKLAPHIEDEAGLDALLDDFSRRGWLSEGRFVEMVVQARQGKYGCRHVAHELREKGVSEEAIAAALPQLKESELETARAVWLKKFGQPPEDAKARAKQMRFMVSRGFGMDVIMKVLRQGRD